MIAAEIRARFWKRVAAVAGGLLLVALLLACIAALWYRGSALSARHDLDNAVAEREAAYQDIASLSATLAAERERATRMAEIAGQYERDKTNAQAAADHTIAGLRAGTVQLRQHWQGCIATSELSAAATGAGQPDAGADDRAESAGRIVRAAAECDAQVRGLQRVVAEDRK